MLEIEAEEISKTVTKKLPAGTWRIAYDLSGKIGTYDPVKVWLRGLRRATPLMQIDEEQFAERHPKAADGKYTDDQFLLRGVPVAWCRYGHLVMLWPAALHDWELVIELRKRNAQ